MKLLIATIATAIAATSATASPLSDQDRAALEQLKSANDDAWNRRDAVTIAGQYVANATVRVAPEADLVDGRAAIARFFAASFARREGEFRHVTSLAHIEPLGDASVLSEGDVRVERRDLAGNWSLVRRFRTITIAVRKSGQWKLRSVRAIPLPGEMAMAQQTGK